MGQVLVAVFYLDPSIQPPDTAKFAIKMDDDIADKAVAYMLENTRTLVEGREKDCILAESAERIEAAVQPITDAIQTIVSTEPSVAVE